jgi:hypothetical protein
MPPKNARPVLPIAARDSTVMGELSADFERECVQFFAELAQMLGVQRSLGQIYGLLFASPRALSFTDLVERLDISNGSASQGLQSLRALGAIKIARPLIPGSLRSAANPSVVSPVEPSRRDYFEPELSLRKLVSGALQKRVMPLATMEKDPLARLRKLAEGDGEENDFLLDRVKQLETWQRRLKIVLPVVNRLLGPKNE